MTKFRGVGSALVGLLLGLTIGGFLIASASAGAQSDDEMATENGLPRVTEVVEYPTNDSGETYGEYRLGTNAPDLVPAQTDGGKPGYIRWTDLMPEPPKNPEEAASFMRERVNEDGHIVLPVYAEDGRTLVGHFTAGAVLPDEE